MQKSRNDEIMAKESSFLGVDFGSAKIGLAIGDEETKIAFALDAFKNDQDFFGKLKKLIFDKNIVRIIVGMARHDKDLSGSQEKAAFGEKLEKELKIPVEFADEMFTTKMAQENIKMRGRKNITRFDDQEAARIILQGWLDSKQP